MSAKWTGKILPDGKGGFDVWDNWTSADEFMHNEGGKMLGGLFAAAILSLFIPPLLIFSWPMDGHKSRVANMVTAVIITIVMIFDYYLGGIMWMIFHEETMWFLEFAVTLNMSLLIFELILIFYANKISPLFEEGMINMFFYVVIGLLTYFIFYPLFENIVVGHAAEEPAKILISIGEWLKSFN